MLTRYNFIQIEEALNQIAKRSFVDDIYHKAGDSSNGDGSDDIDYNAIEENLRAFERENLRAAYAFVMDRLPCLDYIKEDGPAFHIQFCEYAQISEGVWHTFAHAKYALRRHNALKVAVGLRLDEEDMRTFMRLNQAGKSRMWQEDYRDRLIMACLKTDHVQPAIVWEVLEKYATMDMQPGQRRFENIYGADD